METQNETKAKEIAMPCQGCTCKWTKEKMYKQQYCKDCVAQDRFISSIEAMEWKQEQLIDKAWDWLTDQKGERTKEDFIKAIKGG